MVAYKHPPPRSLLSSGQVEIMKSSEIKNCFLISGFSRRYSSLEASRPVFYDRKIISSAVLDLNLRKLKGANTQSMNGVGSDPLLCFSGLHLSILNDLSEKARMPTYLWHKLRCLFFILKQFKRRKLQLLFLNILD